LEAGPIAQGRSLALADVYLHRNDGVHLDGSAGDLAVALRPVDIADGETAAVDEAGEEQRRSLHHLLDVGVPAVLARGNGAQAAVPEAAVGATDVFRHRVCRLRR